MEMVEIMAKSIQYVHYVPGSNKCLTSVICVNNFTPYREGMRITVAVDNGEIESMFFGVVSRVDMNVNVYYTYDEEGFCDDVPEIEEFMTVYLKAPEDY
jgi:hypothetical protein